MTQERHQISSKKGEKERYGFGKEFVGDQSLTKARSMQNMSGILCLRKHYGLIEKFY